MSLLKKRGDLVLIPVVLGQRWVPGYSYTTTEVVKVYVHETSSGSGSSGSGSSGSGSSGSGSGGRKSGGDRYVNFDHGLGGDDFSVVIVDY